ncbi:MAG: hypothetical protein DRI30_04540 [Chloroflexi bacterium]|nr:MAG: hypothetical protein DRI30_04540 [Chloroflexota bacterium]
MTEKQAEKTATGDLLGRLDGARLALVEALEASNHESFASTDGDGDSIKRVNERTVDDVNFYFGRLAARALNLPQPPDLVRADLGSLREGVMALQVAHRSFGTLLHDLLPDDLEKKADDPELGSYTLLQALELAAAQYNQRAQEVRRLASA